MATNVGKRVGRRIRDLRLAAGLSQAKLAERLGPGVAVETVSRFERGVQVPTFEWVQRISTALGTDLDGFLGGFGDTASPVPSPELGRIGMLLAPLPEAQLRHVGALIRAHLDGLAEAALHPMAPSDDPTASVGGRVGRQSL